MISYIKTELIKEKRSANFKLGVIMPIIFVLFNIAMVSLMGKSPEGNGGSVIGRELEEQGYLTGRTWHTSSIYKKINWQCIRSTKKGKKYCPHSKGIQEAAIEKAFVESYRQLCHADSTVIDDFLKIVEEEINDNTLFKDLKKIENQLNRITSQERKLVDLHLEDSIDE